MNIAADIQSKYDARESRNWSQPDQYVHVSNKREKRLKTSKSCYLPRIGRKHSVKFASETQIYSQLTRSPSPPLRQLRGQHSTTSLLRCSVPDESLALLSRDSLDDVTPHRAPRSSPFKPTRLARVFTWLKSVRNSMSPQKNQMTQQENSPSYEDIPLSPLSLSADSNYETRVAPSDQYYATRQKSPGRYSDESITDEVSDLEFSEQYMPARLRRPSSTLFTMDL